MQENHEPSKGGKIGEENGAEERKRLHGVSPPSTTRSHRLPSWGPKPLAHHGQTVFIDLQTVL